MADLQGDRLVQALGPDLKRRDTLSLAEAAIFLQVGRTEAKSILRWARISRSRIPIQRLRELIEKRKLRRGK